MSVVTIRVTLSRVSADVPQKTSITNSPNVLLITSLISSPIAALHYSGPLPWRPNLAGPMKAPKPLVYPIIMRAHYPFSPQGHIAPWPITTHTHQQAICGGFNCVPSINISIIDIRGRGSFPLTVSSTSAPIPPVRYPLPFPTIQHHQPSIALPRSQLLDDGDIKAVQGTVPRYLLCREIEYYLCISCCITCACRHWNSVAPPKEYSGPLSGTGYRHRPIERRAQACPFLSSVLLSSRGESQDPASVCSGDTCQIRRAPCQASSRGRIFGPRSRLGNADKP